MPPFRVSLPRLAQSTASATRVRAREALTNRQVSHPLPLIPVCPPSSCICSDTPQDLDIDRDTPLNGKMAAYQKHILVMTGQTDWLSKVEDEQATSEWGKFTAGLKKTFGRGGEFHDPYLNIPINTSSFRQDSSSPAEGTQQLVMFPTFERITIHSPWQEHMHDLASYIVSGTANVPNATVESIRQPTILVCTHGGRDKRCGILGPLLVNEFKQQLEKLNPLNTSATHHQPSNTTSDFHPTTINVGGISHVGGHKWAGNVIIYIPPHYKLTPNHDSQATFINPLAGKGIWYGRVEPKHVDGIIKQTILGGKVIQELFRGGIDQQGNPLRL